MGRGAGGTKWNNPGNNYNGCVSALPCIGHTHQWLIQKLYEIINCNTYDHYGEGGVKELMYAPVQCAETKFSYAN